MKITKTTSKVVISFKKVKVGETFTYSGSEYIKSLIDFDDIYLECATNLETGEVTELEDSDKVSMTSCELLVRNK